jgi:hypothetical protein
MPMKNRWGLAAALLAAPVFSACSLPQKARAAAGETALVQDRTSTVPANIAPTVATDAHTNVQVFGRPRSPTEELAQVYILERPPSAGVHCLRERIKRIAPHTKIPSA